jgi:hypothetical protein
MSRIGMLISVVSAVSTFLFLTNLLTPSDLPRIAYGFYYGRLFWASVFMIFLPNPFYNKLRLKIIADDETYENTKVMQTTSSIT